MENTTKNQDAPITNGLERLAAELERESPEKAETANFLRSAAGYVDELEYDLRNTAVSG